MHPHPSVFLVSLGSNALASLDDGNTEGLKACLAVIRAGLARLVTTLVAACSKSVVVVLTPVPRLEMSEFHRNAFASASALFTEVTTECGGHVVTVSDVVAEALVGNLSSSPGPGVIPQGAYDGMGVHLSQAAGKAVANAVRDVVLGTFPVGRARPVTAAP